MAEEDPRIGMAVAGDASVIAFDDGSQYEVKDGVITAQTRPPNPVQSSSEEPETEPETPPEPAPETPEPAPEEPAAPAGE